MTISIGLAQVILGVYGVLMIVGGLMGYMKGGSKVSLFAGAIAGGLCIVATWMSFDQPADGLSFGGIVAFLLTGVFINRFSKTRAFVPAGLMLVLSLFVGTMIILVQRQIGLE